MKEVKLRSVFDLTREELAELGLTEDRMFDVFDNDNTLKVGGENVYFVEVDETTVLYSEPGNKVMERMLADFFAGRNWEPAVMKYFCLNDNVLLHDMCDGDGTVKHYKYTA